MNAVRKHLSTIKGGCLAATTKARVVSLIVCDIPGDTPAFMASGPTGTNVNDFRAIVIGDEGSLRCTAPAGIAAKSGPVCTYLQIRMSDLHPRGEHPRGWSCLAPFIL
ncbi:protein of unknown function [Rhizobium sp. RU35A]|nr:protein of unknown function [Rhizobium sp. RU35A]